jgi:hypothetical protein
MGLAKEKTAKMKSFFFISQGSRKYQGLNKSNFSLK